MCIFSLYEWHSFLSHLLGHPAESLTAIVVRSTGMNLLFFQFFLLFEKNKKRCSNNL